MSSVSSLPQPWFPSCLKWEPVLDPLGEPVQGLRKRRGSPEVFGMSVRGSHNDHILSHYRESFAGMLVVQLVLPFFRIPLRLGHLVAGDFVTPGLERADAAWELRLQRWSKLSKDPAAKPGAASLVAFQIFYVTRECFKNVAKIGLYAIVGCPFGPLWWISLYGALLNPIDAGFLYSKVEGWTARDRFSFMTKDYRQEERAVGDYAMGCQQPSTVIDGQDFYRTTNGDKPSEFSPGHWMHCVRVAVQARRAFFLEEGLDIAGLERSLELWPRLLRLFDLTDRWGDFYPSVREMNPQIIPQLARIDQALLSIRTWRCEETVESEAQIAEQKAELQSAYNAVHRFFDQQRQAYALAHQVARAILDEPEFTAYQGKLREAVSESRQAAFEALPLPGPRQAPLVFDLTSVPNDTRKTLARDSEELRKLLRYNIEDSRFGYDGPGASKVFLADLAKSLRKAPQ